MITYDNRTIPAGLEDHPTGQSQQGSKITLIPAGLEDRLRMEALEIADRTMPRDLSRGHSDPVQNGHNYKQGNILGSRKRWNHLVQLITKSYGSTYLYLVE